MVAGVARGQSGARRPRRWAAYAAGGLALLCACATNPVTGRPQFVLMSEAQEITLGRQSDPQITAGMGVYGDEALQRYVEGVAMPMARASERPALPWQFRVMDDPIVNAFALPGGFIYVTRGILAHMSSEAELAGVLGHEIGHVTARHSVSQYTKQMGAQLVLLPTAVLLPAELQGIGGLLGGGFQLLFLKYGRDDERQSDELGLGYMARAGHDPGQMVTVFETLGRATRSEDGGRVPEWLATHPSPANRGQLIRRQIARLPASQQAGRVGREAFLARIDGLVYGEDPREGFFGDANVFHHPAFEFRIAFPQGWKTLNQRAVVAAVSPEQDAAIQLALAKGKDAREAASTFLAGEGIQSTPLETGRINGLEAASAEFAVASQTPLRGSAVFVEHGGRVYGLLGYAPESKYAARQAALRAALTSFARETDRRVLEVQPWRIQIVTPARSLGQAEFARTYPGPVAADELARVNQLDAGERYPAGRPAKRVVGKALPR
jgi:predicted Zn-dependent protease